MITRQRPPPPAPGTVTGPPRCAASHKPLAGMAGPAQQGPPGRASVRLRSATPRRRPRASPGPAPGRSRARPPRRGLACWRRPAKHRPPAASRSRRPSRHRQRRWRPRRTPPGTRQGTAAASAAASGCAHPCIQSYPAPARAASPAVFRREVVVPARNPGGGVGSGGSIQIRNRAKRHDKEVNVKRSAARPALCHRRPQTPRRYAGRPGHAEPQGIPADHCEKSRQTA